MFVLSTDRKGNIAEQAIALAATRLNIDVYRPAGEGGRYDLIFDLGARLLRVQCKWVGRCGDILKVPCYSNRRAREGLRRRGYTLAEIDAIAAYSPDLDRCYLLPGSLVTDRRQVSLRLTKARNNQEVGLNWAHDYEFSSIDWSRAGAIAQLEERRHGMAEAVGSSPTSSTPLSSDLQAFQIVGADEFRNRLGHFLQLATSGIDTVVTRRGKPLVRLSAIQRSERKAG